MFRTRRHIATIILISQLFSYPGMSVFAEGDILHSLDELPSIHAENTPTPSSSESEKSDDSFATLLRAKSEYEKTESPKTLEASALVEERETYIAANTITSSPVLEPTFITNPFFEAHLNQNSLLSGWFFGSGSQTEIDSGETGKQWKTHSKNRISGVNGDIAIGIEPGTIITTEAGENIESTRLVTQAISSFERSKAMKKYEKSLKNRGNLRKGTTKPDPQGFDFGIPGKHLIFSEPVQLTIDIPNASEGMIFDLLTMHAGDTDFHTVGLSVDPKTGCNPDGSATIPGSQIIVKNGKVTFYTCGASSFTMNPTGGISGSNDLRVVIGDCGQFQAYYNGQQNIYTGTPPVTGCNTALDSWIALGIGATTYWNDANNWTTASTVGSTTGNTYTATTTLMRTVGGRNYTLTLNWSHTVPNKYFTVNWTLDVPTGNTNAIKFYIGNDSMVGGDDANDTGYSGSAPSPTIGVYDSVLNQISAIRYLSGSMWTGGEVGGYTNIRTRINGRKNFNNSIQTTPGDLGFGVNWDFGTTPGTYSGTFEWRVLPFTTTNIVDLVPGIGQPEGPLTTGFYSQLPIILTNAGNTASSGTHTVVLTIPANISGPTASFVDNGWSCGAQAGTTITCTKNTVINSLESDTVNIPVLPSAAAGGTSVTFNVAISGGADGNLANNSAFATNAVVSGAPAVSPGGITGSILWLKANGGTSCTTSGCALASWNDQSGLSNNATQATATNRPAYVTSSMNFNPVVRFNSAAATWLGVTANFPETNATIFTVFRSTSPNGTILSHVSPVSPSAGAHDRHLFLNAGRLGYRIWSEQTIYTPTTFNNGIAKIAQISYGAGTPQNIKVNGKNHVTGTMTASAFNWEQGITIGGHTQWGYLNGDVAEILYYSGLLSTTNKNQVESYLALKYGITLDQSPSTSYTLSNGTIVWNAAMAGGYNSDIAGIARDDTSVLGQIKSQSINSVNDIIVEKSVIGMNRLALTWANNADNTSILTTTDAPIGYSRLAREWQFQEKNGDIGTVTISYPVTALPSGFSGTLKMFVDSDGIFASGSTAYTGTLSSGNWNFSVNIADMTYITFGGNNITDSTPPVISSISIASGVLIPRGDFALTVNYSDTGAGIQTSSFSGKIYAWNAVGSTWSTTDIASSYMSVASATSTTGALSITGLPYGKYRFDISVADTAGNITTQSYTYFVDAIEWTVSSDTYNIGDISQNTATFGSGELIITVKTVGAGFALVTSPGSPLTSPSSATINYWNGSWGVGYDLWNGSGFGGAILTYSPNATIATMGKNIHPDGTKYTYTYRVKYGALVDSSQEAGDYYGTVSFRITLDY